MNISKLLGIVFLTLLNGCSQHRIGQVESLSLDASERVVFTNNGKVCAEPSPDAVKSIAEAVALKVADYGELSQSYATTMASIGLRTAGVQILRDIAFRACEAYSNGAFGSDYSSLYEEIVEGSDDAAVALVAVEGLTAIRPAPAVAISSSASGSTATTGGPVSATTQPATINFNAASGQPFTADQTKSVAEAVVKIVEAIIKNNTSPEEEKSFSSDKN